MNTFGLLVLFFLGCLVFYFLGRKSKSASIAGPTDMRTSEPMIDEKRMLPGMRKRPPSEVAIIKLTIGLVVKVGRGANANPELCVLKPMEIFDQAVDPIV